MKNFKANYSEFGPLAGVKVAVSGVAVAGPFAAGLMADYGADVLFIESAKAPDITRGGNPFEQNHRNQRTIAIDVPSEEGREIFKKIISQTEIFIENSKAGQWDKWGFSDDELWKINPKLVIAHVSGFGQTGVADYLRRGSWDTIGQAFSGFMHMNGMPAPQPPLVTNPYMCDYITAMFASWACLAAYIKMQKSGQGDSIDIAQYEALVYLMADAVMNYYNHGIPFKRLGTENNKYGAWKTYKCTDGEVFLAPAGMGAITKGLKFLGLEYPSEIFPKNQQRFPAGSKAAQLVEEKLNEYCSKHTMDEAEKELNDVGLLCSPIMTHEKMIDNPQYKSREVLVDWEDADGKMIKGVNTVFKFKRNPGKIWRGAPKYGADNEAVMAELGYSAKEIQAFYEKSILAK